jgi:lysyl-tRNA synthetase class 2
VLRIERHPLGPRVYLLGARIHEWHLGTALLLALAAAAALDRVELGAGTVLMLGLGVWLVAKDWRDLSPTNRDTASWRLGLHAAPTPLRTVRRADPLPNLAAAGATLAGLVNLASAVSPSIAWRSHVLLQIAPLQALRVSHAAAVPASLLLLATAPYLWRRRRGALRLAVLLLLVLAGLDLLKGLDAEPALGSLGLGVLLWTGRGSFCVRHDPVTLRAAARRVPLLALGGLSLCLLAVWLAAPGQATLGAVVRETADALLWQPGPLDFHDELAGVDEAVGAAGLLTLLICLGLLLRPLAAPRSLPDVDVHAAVRRLVRRHGHDTLAYFKLRRDQHYLFSPDGRAFLGYRVEAGVLLVSGDPVGCPDALPALFRRLGEFAESRGLRLAAIGAGERLLPLWRQLGLRALYLGDEAVVDTHAFSLDGRAIRKVRQSVSRLERAGFAATLLEVGALGDAELAELDALSRRWRGGAGERGFSMSLDTLRRDDHADSLVLVARDEAGRAGGFLHFAPSYGRSAVSLSLMRRERDTPNGLTEFMVVRAVESLRERGIEEVSLNFSVFARLIHEPTHWLEQLLGRGLLLADRSFQIERLYRFNAKFFPRWEPRYFVYERRLALPRAGLAALWAEGQLPKPWRR